MKTATETKHYVPEIEEFYVGFEFEISEKGKWIKESIGLYDLSWVSETPYLLETKQIRVKHLDREDIESLGFELNGGSGNLVQYNLGTYLLYEIKNTNSIGIKEIIDFNVVENLFYGKIKNKSELKRILTQIGVL